jgi:hypothetical protein
MYSRAARWPRACSPLSVASVTERAEVSFGEEVARAYAVAMKNGRWTDTYAATDEYEYWAEGVEIYFSGPEGVGESGPKVGVESRKALSDYDQGLFELLQWAFGDDAWSPRCPKRAPPLAGRPCSAPYAGDDVLSLSIPGETAQGSLSLHGPSPVASHAREPAY